MREKTYYVYILANRHRTIYTGVTSDLLRRVAEHKAGIRSVFTTKYKIHRLVYFESTTDVLAAIQREKQIKGWVRRKKIQLIETTNPEWKDLSYEWR